MIILLKLFESLSNFWNHCKHEKKKKKKKRDNGLRRFKVLSKGKWTGGKHRMRYYNLLSSGVVPQSQTRYVCIYIIDLFLNFLLLMSHHT